MPCDVQRCLTRVWIGPSFLNSSIQLLPKITVIMTKDEVAEELEEMKEHRRRKEKFFVIHWLQSQENGQSSFCLPVSLMPRFLEAARSTVKDCKKEMERRLIPFISLHEMISQDCDLRESRKTKESPNPGLIQNQNTHYSEKWLQMECPTSKHYTQNCSYLPSITVSKLLISGAVLPVIPVRPEKHPEILK